MAPAILSLASILTNLTISSQNCNSLNVSTNCPKQSKKLYSIADIGSDIIFLCDLRLNNKDSVQDISSVFLNLPKKQYNFTYNSSKSSRGNGILISTKLNHVILSTFRDTSENILVLYISIENHNFLIASIYGPNSNDPAFFRDITRFISIDPDANIILGGDWNLTFSINDNPDNIDIFRMQTPPSL